jgi:hypothetical protein
MQDLSFVGRTGFEPATPWSQTRYSTGLNYLPNFLFCRKSALFHATLPLSSGIFYQAELPPAVFIEDELPKGVAKIVDQS